MTVLEYAQESGYKIGFVIVIHAAALPGFRSLTSSAVAAASIKQVQGMK
jgi:hypothetical protein